MKRPSLNNLLNPSVFAASVILFILTTFSVTALAQGGQLTLADILIGLRSKKVSLPERNQILTEAVQTRGITFTLTPEIEKELSSTGADAVLIDSIRKKGQIVKISNTATPVDNKPKVETVLPPPPDFAFYEKRAAASAAKGEHDAAIADYTKALEMNATSVTAFLGRGVSHFGKKQYDLAVADYGKVLEVLPRNTPALAGRADAYEKLGKLDLAEADYKKVLEIEPANEFAKADLNRVQAEIAKAVEAAKPKPEPIVPPVTSQPLPEFVSLGQLTETDAVKMVKPAYSPTASRMNIGGKVTVEIEIDTEGNVTSANAINGHQFLRQESEIAALKSKFKPAMIGNKPVKAKAQIVYNFVARR